MKRTSPIDPKQLSAEQRAVYDTIANGPRKGVRGPLAVWLQRPQLADRAQALGLYCRFDISLPPILSELAILFVSRYWLVEYEWAAHKPLALEVGMSSEVIDAMRDGRRPVFARRDEELVFAFLSQLHAQRKIDDALYQQLSEEIGNDGIVDLVGIAGYYTLISMTAKAFEVPLPAGVTPELSQELLRESGSGGLI